MYVNMHQFLIIIRDEANFESDIVESGGSGTVSPNINGLKSIIKAVSEDRLQSMHLSVQPSYSDGVDDPLIEFDNPLRRIYNGM
jgi:hypothetical protein